MDFIWYAKQTVNFNFPKKKKWKKNKIEKLYRKLDGNNVVHSEKGHEFLYWTTIRIHQPSTVMPFQLYACEIKMSV